tara:strand:- start:302 stop:718 length:417 start_codon:yes stop_codon:yes gene_type:complete
MAFTRKAKTKSEISTASLPDIIFMLLIFFMVTTVIKKYSGIPGIKKPKAEQIKKLKNKKSAVYLWVTKDGFYSINDQAFENISELSDRLLQIDQDNITVNIETDKDTQYKDLQDVHNELREAETLKVMYKTDKKSTGK